MKKRIFAAILAALLVIGAMPLSTFAAEVQSVESTDLQESYAENNELVLTYVSLKGLQKPSVGDYVADLGTLSTSGIGYSIDTSYSYYETVSIGDYTLYDMCYVKNGVGFYDKTGHEWFDYYNGTFSAGHTYTIHVYLVAAEGCKFDTANMSAYFSGEKATVIPDEECPAERLCLTYDFYCDTTTIELIMLNNVNAPVAGETPADYSITPAYPEYYVLDNDLIGYVNGIRWVNSAGTQLSKNSKFVEGETYQIQIAIESAKKNGKDVSSFTSGVEAMVDGEYVVSDGGWDEVYCSSSSLVYVYYTLPETVAAPEEPEDTVIHYVNINDVFEPQAFGVPEYSASVYDFVNYSVNTDEPVYSHTYNGVLWYDSTNGVIFNPETSRVVPENSYTAVVFLKANDGYTFDTENLTCNFGNYEGNVYFYGDNPQYVCVYMEYYVPEYIIDTVDLWISPPVGGAYPDYAAEILDPVYRQGEYGDVTTGIVWEDITDGFEGVLSEGDVFLPGHEYAVSICLNPADGCKFATDAEGYPTVYAMVNDKQSSVLASDLYPADEYVFVVAYLSADGELGDKLQVSHVDIEVDVPEAGAEPDFDPELYANQWQYIYEVVWEDVTPGFESQFSEGDTFLPGHEYMITVCIKANTGFGYATDMGGYPDVDAYINNERAGTVATESHPWAEYIFIYQYFTVEGALSGGDDEREVGDINGDGLVNSLDANYLARALGGAYEIKAGTAEAYAADLNGDGKINALDVNIFKRLVAGA
ncbi:MAG: dockerin type I repeat-containing protein [Clostridia bacterium]|nr:dockerin type I repeat-containing protein [Clostridia bacterium]